MLTKVDLSAIQKMFDESKKETSERFTTMDKRFDRMDKRFDRMDKRLDSMDKKIDNLSDRLQKNTEELIELITAGFNSYDKRMLRIEEKVFKTN